MRHEFECTGTVNLVAYLGCLRSTETFEAQCDDLTLIRTIDGPSRGLSPNIGAIKLRLLAATKSNRTITADIVVTFTTLSGFSLGWWLERLLPFQPMIPGHLFSTDLLPVWDSQHFRRDFAIPILKLQRKSGEPTLLAFSGAPGHRLQDKIDSMHTWR
jgi:hypothetical protein